MSAPGKNVFHRYQDDYLSSEQWGSLLRADARIARALGPEPLPDARHLLPPLAAITPVEDDAPAVPLPGVDFTVELRSDRPKTVAEAYPLFPPEIRAALEFPRVFVTLPGRDGRSERLVPIDDAPESARIARVTLAWSLPDMLSIDDVRQTAADLRRFVAESAAIGVAGGFTVTAREDAGEVAKRAASLRTLLHRIGGRTEMRLLPLSGSFPSRSVWRALYSLGLTWGSMDLFHWTGGTDRSQFRVLSSGTPAYFFPERVSEGERLPGLTMEFDLPRSPDPIAVFDRMTVALAYLRDTLGGRPIAADGGALEGDRLDDERDALHAALQAMTDAGITPASLAALRYF